MESTVSLKLNREFQRVYRKGNYKAGKYIAIYILKNVYDYNRIGISTGKKVGNSVQRNRIRRLIKESYRNSEKVMKKGFDIVISVKASDRSAKTPNNRLKAVSLPTYQDVDKELKKLLGKLDIFEKSIML